MTSDLTHQIRAERREKKKKTKMRVHGAGMKKLASFISKKTSGSPKERRA